MDPRKLEQYNISLTEVQAAINNNNANAGGSVLTRGDLGYVVRGIGLVKTLEGLGSVVVKSVNGVPILLKDLGGLQYGNLERKGILGYTDRQVNYNEGVAGIVLLLKGQNPSIVLEGIHAAVEDLNRNILPEGVSVRPYLDRTDLVHTTLSTVSHTLLEGVGLVIIVLIVFGELERGADRGCYYSACTFDCIHPDAFYPYTGKPAFPGSD